MGPLHVFGYSGIGVCGVLSAELAFVDWGEEENRKTFLGVEPPSSRTLMGLSGLLHQ